MDFTIILGPLASLAFMMIYNNFFTQKDLKSYDYKERVRRKSIDLGVNLFLSYFGLIMPIAHTLLLENGQIIFSTLTFSTFGIAVLIWFIGRERIKKTQRRN